jgi:PAS domain S-box-containing protein
MVANAHFFRVPNQVKEPPKDTSVRNDRFRRLIEQSADIVYETDLAGKFTYVNAAAARIFGFQSPEVLGRSYLEFVAPDHRARLRDVYRNQRRDLQPDTYTEFPALAQDGRLVWIGQHVQPVLEDGKLQGFQAMARDITEIVHTRRALDMQRDLVVALGTTRDLPEALGRALDVLLTLEAVDAGGIYLVDPADRHLRLMAHRDLSEAFVARVADVSPDLPEYALAMAGQPVYRVYREILQAAPADKQDGVEFRALAAVPVSYEGDVIAHVNLVTWSETTFSEQTRKTIEAVVAQLGTMIVRVRAESAVRRREAILAALADGARELLSTGKLDEQIDRLIAALGKAARVKGIVMLSNVVDDTGALYFTRPHAWSDPPRPQDDPAFGLIMSSYEQEGYGRWPTVLARGEVIASLICDLPEEERAVFNQGGVASVLAVPIFVGDAWWGLLGCDDGANPREWQAVEVDAMRAAAGVLGAAIARKQADEGRAEMQARLLDIRNMEAISQLAAGLAHNINNILTGILGHCDLLLLEPLGPGAAKNVAAIQEGGRRAAGLTAQMLGYAQQQMILPRRANLNDFLHAARARLGDILGLENDLIFRLQADLEEVEIDRNQIDSILDSLTENARDAMGEAPGKMEIETANESLDQEAARQLGSLGAGGYVRLTLRDTGRGMDAATMARIFEPFFTTKKLARRAGLSLSMVFGAIKQNGGGVAVESRVAQGTRFDIYFPVAGQGKKGTRVPGRGV